MTLPLEECERQALLLALARLSLERPGWDDMLNRIARRIDNDEGQRAKLYDQFRAIHRVPPSPLLDAIESVRTAVLASEEPQSRALFALAAMVGVCLAANCTTTELRHWLSTYFGIGSDG